MDPPAAPPLTQTLLSTSVVCLQVTRLFQLLYLMSSGEILWLYFIILVCASCTWSCIVMACTALIRVFVICYPLCWCFRSRGFEIQTRFWSRGIRRVYQRSQSWSHQLQSQQSQKVWRHRANLPYHLNDWQPLKRQELVALDISLIVVVVLVEV